METIKEEQTKKPEQIKQPEQKKVKEKEYINLLNKEGAKKFLERISFPVYFLDFEAITNTKEWMYKNDLAIDQQISSFSILRINSLKDDETKIKHYNTVGEKEDYAKMSKKLTDFYKDKNATIIVWGQDLELRSLAKLFRESPEGSYKKLSYMISNILDLQQLFYSGGFVKIEPKGKSSLDMVAKAFDVYLKTKIKDGKSAHYLLEHSVTNKDIRESHLDSIKKRLQDYNNADIINMKRVLVSVINLLDKKEND